MLAAPERIGKLEQTTESVGGDLQLVPTDEENMGGGHAQAVGGRGKTPWLDVSAPICGPLVGVPQINLTLVRKW